MIQRQTVVNAPIERVWAAISDHRQFGERFKVSLDQPFAVGKPSTGRITRAGYEHIRWNAEIVAIDAPTYFAYRWHRHGGGTKVDDRSGPTTLVEFRLTRLGSGATRVEISESGFELRPSGAIKHVAATAAPATRRAKNSTMLSAPGIADRSALFAALGDPTRLAIVNRLSHGEARLTDLVSLGSVTRQAVAKHVAVLERAGLLATQRRGRERIVRLEPARLDQAADCLADVAR